MTDKHPHTPWSISRRSLLALLGSSGTLLLVRRANAQAACVLTPAQTEGPYFVDERLNRSDIRSDPADGSVRPGIPLDLTLRIAAMDGSRCAPLAGAIVDIWHCDAAGVYSDVSDRSFDSRGSKFLRGYQITVGDGIVRFTTIYPGWYPGRAVHIHFKVRAQASSGKRVEFTSQLYFDDAFTDRVHAREPYAQRGQRRLRNDGDGIFRRDGSQLMLSPVETGQGYAATFDVALRMA